MARRPRKPCAEPGCGKLTEDRYCERHQQEQRRECDQGRPSAARRGYGRAWQRARAAFLRQHPLCCHCQRRGRTTPASVVDHVRPHRGDAELFWDQANWEAICKPCHDRKTAEQDGGFGNRG